MWGKWTEVSGLGRASLKIHGLWVRLAGWRWWVRDGFVIWADLLRGKGLVGSFGTGEIWGGGRGGWRGTREGGGTKPIGRMDGGRGHFGRGWGKLGT